MKKGLVNILMPVMNGELLLPQALASLLAQDYKNLEIVILDNLSTDGTRAICEQYASRDPRVRYIADNQNRITHDAANYLATFITGEYAMYACDDDLWEPSFISKLTGRLQANSDLGLVFSNGVYVDMDGKKGLRLFLRGRTVYRLSHSEFSNCWNYMSARRVVPMLFGIFKTNVLKRALPFDTFDETIADVDNLFMVKLLSITKVECVNEPLFYYRNKFRWADPDLLPNYPKNGNIFRIWMYDFIHQLRFTRKMIHVVAQSEFPLFKKLLLVARAIQTMVLQLTLKRLKAWFGQTLIKHGWRHGVSQTRDVSADIRHKALLDNKSAESK